MDPSILKIIVDARDQLGVFIVEERVPFKELVRLTICRDLPYNIASRVRPEVPPSYKGRLIVQLVLASV